MIDSCYMYGNNWGSLSVEKDTSGNPILYVVDTNTTGKMCYTVGDNGKKKAEEAYQMMKCKAYIEYRYA